jgi:hypothetical protein
MSVPAQHADVAAVERWLLARGLPHFIHDYNASRDIFTRVLPLLTLLLLLEFVGALNFSWPWWANLMVVAACFAALLAVWTGVNRLRHLPLLSRPDRVGPVELGVFLILPSALPLAAGGQVLTAVNTLVGNCVLLGAVYLTTSYGVIPMTRWAGGRLRNQVGDVVGLLVRALPLMLLFVVFLFLTTEMWQVAASLDGPSMVVIVGMLVVLGALFVASRTPAAVGELSSFGSWDEVMGLVRGTPAERLPPAPGATAGDTPPLSRRQWGNVGLVVLFIQGLQVMLVSVMIGVFLVAFGLVAVTPALAREWTGGALDVVVQGTLWGRPFALSVELIQVCALLAAVAGFSFTLSLLTDETYRREFLVDVLAELRQAFAVRAAYLTAIGAGRD